MNLNQNTLWDVIVVGAGLVGLSCALALAKQNFRVLILEAKQNPKIKIPSKNDPIDVRVVALSRASEHFLDQIGVWSTIKQSRIGPYQHMTVWDQSADGEIHFSAWDFFEPNLGHIIEQSVILGALWQALEENPQVSLLSGVNIHQLQDDKTHMSVFLEQVHLKAKLVIGADGANSIIRRKGAFQVKGWEYEQSAIIATIQSQLTHNETAYQRFASDGSLALLPLADQNHTSIVWATSPAQASQLCAKPAEEFNQILTRESQAILGDLKVVGPRFQIPLRTHHVQSYVTSRCALIGDAAHTLHPLAGQGVNLGFLDVFTLIQKLIHAKERKRDFGDLKVLQRYDRERRLHNQIMIWSMEIFKRGFMSQSPLVSHLRNWGLNWVNKQEQLKQLFAKLAMGSWAMFGEKDVTF